MPANNPSDSTKAHDDPDEILVWRLVATHPHTCDMGKAHEVGTWLSKRLRRIGAYKMDNGYEQRLMPVYVDRQGRVYQTYIDSDYFATVRYHELDADGQIVRHWYARVTVHNQVAVDILGRAL